MKKAFGILTLVTVLLFAVSALAANKVVVIPLNTSSNKAGSVSVAGAAFHDKNENDACLLNQGNFYAMYDGGNGCDAFSSIQIPHGASVTRMDCTIYDNGVGNFLVTLERRDLQSGNFVAVFQINNSTNSTNVQKISDTTTSYPLIDNSNFAYFIWADFGPAAGTNSRLYGCTVSYN